MLRNITYTYCTSDKCVKLEELRQLVDGLYSWHPCTKYSTASRIYECDLNLENNSGITKQFSNYKYTLDDKKFILSKCTLRAGLKNEESMFSLKLEFF